MLMIGWKLGFKILSPILFCSYSNQESKNLTKKSWYLSLGFGLRPVFGNKMILEHSHSFIHCLRQFLKYDATVYGHAPLNKPNPI